MSNDTTTKTTLKDLHAKAHEAYLKLLVASNTLEDCGVAENEGAILIVKEVTAKLWEMFEGLEGAAALLAPAGT